MGKEKISTRIEKIKLEVEGLESSAKLLSVSFSEADSPIPPRELSGIFALFLTAVKGVWDELSDISDVLAEKGV